MLFIKIEYKKKYGMLTVPIVVILLETVFAYIEHYNP